MADSIRKLARYLHQHPKARAWTFFVCTLLCVLAFAGIADEVFELENGVSDAVPFDSFVSHKVQAFRSSMATQAMTDLTALGSLSVSVTLFVIMASVLFTFGDRVGLLYLSVILSGSATLPVLLKSLFNRERPELVGQLVNVSYSSFPSGHSFGAASVYLALAVYAAKYSRTWRQEVFFYFLGLVLISVVGLSRVYLGVHYPTDVLAGLSAGAAWTFLVSAVFEWGRSGKTVTHPSTRPLSNSEI